MAIQLRRGAYADFDPAKLLPGELAVVLSGDPASDNGRSIYVCFAPGEVKRFATYADMMTEIENATEDIKPILKADILAEINKALYSGGIFHSGAFSDVENSLTAEDEGKVLDARQGKILKEMIPELANDLTTEDERKALDARQGKILNEKFSDYYNVSEKKTITLNSKWTYCLKVFGWGIKAPIFPPFRFSSVTGNITSARVFTSDGWKTGTGSVEWDGNTNLINIGIANIADELIPAGDVALCELTGTLTFNV